MTANQGSPGSSPWPVSGTVGVSSLPSLPTGSNTIGKVGVSSLPSLPAGSNTIGNVGVSSLPSLPSGSNNIGNVGVSSLPSLPTGSNNIGSVGVSSLPSLPAGSNDIGTVHLATPTTSASDIACQIPDGSNECVVNNATEPAPAGAVIDMISVRCQNAPGHKVDVSFNVDGVAQIEVPLTFAATVTTPPLPTSDVYSGVLTNLGYNSGLGSIEMFVDSDYTAASGNGATCSLTWVVDQN